MRRVFLALLGNSLIDDLERQIESQFVQQRQRPHRHAHCLGRIFDNGGRNTLLQHRAAFVYQRLEYATGVETTTVVNKDWGLAQLGDVIERLGQRLLASLLAHDRSEEHTSELQSLMRISYAVFCLKKIKNTT